MTTKRNLVIVPVGNPIDKFVKMHNLDFDMSTHWRNLNNDQPRNYDILAIQYSDYVPEGWTYDELIVMKGFKWEHLKYLNEFYKFNQYQYIGVYDDDVVLSKQTMTDSFDFATERNLAAFQLSVDEKSESSYPILRQNPMLLWAETNFMEIMCPVFRHDCYVKLIELISKYDVKWGWGLDYVFAPLFESNIGVLHHLSMFHPARLDTGTNVDKTDAFAEMEKLLGEHFPKYKQQQWHASPPMELAIYLK